MDLNELYNAYLDSTGVCTDTRKLINGNIFFSLKGDNFNGNLYAKKAYEKGAKYCVVDEIESKYNEHFILVDDVLNSLQKLAAHHRTVLGLKVISLTGSNGKTTTKELINAVLSKKYLTVATEGNLNNHIGVPLTLLKMNRDTDIGIVEMGANHLKEIEFLCEIAKPDYGLITNFGKAHLEGFGSVEKIVEGKSELYQYLIEHDRAIFINGEQSRQMDVIKSLNGLNSVIRNTNQIKNIKIIESQPYLKISYDGVIVSTKLTGLYNFENILNAIIIGEHFNIPRKNSIDAITGYSPQNNRSQLIHQNGNTIILDAYNANPSSMVASIDNFAEAQADTKIAILGDMFELGNEAEREHLSIADYAIDKNFNALFVVGENFYKIKKTDTTLNKFKTFEDLKAFFKTNSFTNSSFLIKGSRGMALERIVELL